MLREVHEHVVGELQQNARTDTVFVVTAVLFNLVVLGINCVDCGAPACEAVGLGDSARRMLIRCT